VGGILNGSAVGNNTNTIAGTGTLQGPSLGTGDLVIANWNTTGFITAAGGASSNTNAYLKFSDVIGGTGGVTFTGAPLAMTYPSVSSTWTGVTTVNGSMVDVAASVPGGVASVLGASSADPANLILDGGGLFDNQGSAVTVGRLFSIGLDGATLHSESAGAFTFNGSFNGSTAIGLVGAGARTLTLQGSGTAANTLGLVLGDNGGPTSLVKQGSGLWALSANNTYTGTTTILNGDLRIAIAGGLPGGLGYGYNGTTTTTVSTSDTGGGNLVFAGTGANNAALELTTASGGFFRNLGTGFDQVQWAAGDNGGFAASGSDQVVNLGGNTTPATLVWNSTPGFVGSGNLIFGDASATNKVTFMNPIDLNGSTARTVQVDNGNAVIEAEISGAIVNNEGGTATFTKTGQGALLLSGTNNATGLINTAVNAGFLVLPNLTTAVPGSAGGRTITVGANAAVVQSGATDLSGLLGRINAASTGVVAFDTSGSVSVDMSNAALANVYLGAFSSPGGTPIYYNGTITPNSNTYKFAQATQTAPNGTTGGIGQPFNLLVLNGTNMLVDGGSPRSVIFGGNSTTQGGTGDFYVTNYNTYSGGTLIGEATGAAGTNTGIGFGNDSAFGTGLVTFNDGRIGALDGDHTLSNNIKTTGTTNNTSLAGNLGNEGVVNYGGMTYLGTADFTSLTSGGIFTRSSATPAIFLGDVKTNGSNNLNLVVQSTVEFLTTPPGAVATKTMSGGVKGFSYVTNPSGSLVIDSAGSLGPAPAANVATFFNLSGVTNATLQVLPGITSSITLSPYEGLTTSSGALFAFTVNGAPTLTDSTGTATNGLIGSSQLVFPGVISGSSSGAPALNKLGYGTLVLQGSNTANLSTTSPIAIDAGTLKLDFANRNAGEGILTYSTTMGLLLGYSVAANTSVGYASTGVSAGVTLALAGKSGQTNAQSFGPVTNYAKDNNLTINSNGGTVNLTLGVITNTLGGTLAVTLPTSGTLTISNSNTVSTNGLLVDANANPYVIVGGTDWGALSGTSLVAGSSVGGFYTPNSSTALTANSNADMTSAANLSATSTTVASLRFNANSTLTLGLGANTLVTGGILMGTGAGANNQIISGSTGTLQGTQLSQVGKNLPIYQADTSATLTIGAIIANNSAATTTPATALSKAGPGTLILTGSNTYTGVTYFNGGVISVPSVSLGGAAGPLGSSTNAAANWVFNGGTLQYTGATGTTDHGATFNAVSAIDVTQSGTSLTLTNSTIAITGLANTPGILRKLGPGNLIIGGTTGADTNLSVEVENGTLTLGRTGTGVAVQQANGAALIVDSGAAATVVSGGASTQVDSASSVVVKTGGTFDLNGVGLTFDGLAGGGTMTSSTGTPTLTLGSANDAAIGPYTVGAAAAGVASTGLANFSGNVTGSIALTKNGAGTQILSGTGNTYSGATTINSGTLRLGASNVLPSGAGMSSVSIVGNTLVNGLIVPGTLDLGGYSQSITGLNSTTGGYVTNTIPLVASGNTWTATPGTSTLTIGVNNTSSSFNGTIQDGLTIVPNPGSGAATSVAGVLALTKTGSGTLTLAGSSTYSGGTTVSGGTLVLGNANALGTGSLTANAGTLNLNGFSPSVGTLGGAAGNIISSTAATLTTACTANATFGGTITGAASLSKSGSGSLTLSGTASSYTGSTTVNSGTLTFASIGNENGGPSSLGNPAPGNGQISVSNTANTTLQFVGATTSTTNRVIATGPDDLYLDASGTGGAAVVFDDGTTPIIIGNSNTLNLLGSGIGQINSPITNLWSGGPMTKTGTGTWILAGSSTFSGPISITGGTLQITTDNATGPAPLGVAPATLTANSIVLNGGALSANGTFSLSPSRGIALGPATGSGSGTLDVTAGNTLTYGGVIANNGSGTGSLTKSGSGTLVLAGSNTYTGSTNVNNGTLSFATLFFGFSSQPLGPGSTVTLGVAGTSSGTLLYTGGTATLDKNVSALGNGGDVIQNGGSGLLTLSGTIAKNGTKLTLSPGSSGITVTGAIVGDSSGSDLIVSGGSGAVTLTNPADSYNGPTTVTGGGTLTLGTSGVIPSAGALTLNNGTVNLNGFTQTVGSMTVTAGNGTARVVGSTSTAPLMVSGILTLNGTLTLNANGTPSGAGLYKLIGYQSETGAGGFAATNTASGYSLLVGSTETDLQHNATLGSSLTSLPSVNARPGASVAVSGTFSSSAPAGSAAASVTFASTGTLTAGSFSPSGTQVAVGATPTLNATVTASSTAGSATWQITGSDSSPGLTSATIGGTIVTYDLAQPSYSNATLAFGNVHVGATQTLQIANAVRTSSTYQDSLDVVATNGGNAAISVANPSNLTAGASGNITFTVSEAGSLATTASIGLTSNCNGVPGLSNSTLPTGSVAITGAAYNPASANKVTSSVNLGVIHAGDSFGTQALSIQNTAPSGSYTEGLDASLGGATGDATFGGTPVTNLGGQGTSNSLTVGLGNMNMTTCGTKTGTVTLNLTSNGTNSSLASTTLASQTINVHGNVFTGNATWTGGSGQWGSQGATTNWTDANSVQAAPGTFAGYANSDTATFDNTGLGSGGSATVDLGGATPSLQAMTFNTTGGGGYAVTGSGGGSLTLSGSGGPATITVTSGTHAISAPIALASNLNVGGSGQMTISGTIAKSGTATVALAKYGSGTLVLAGVNTYDGGTTIDGGTVSVSDDTNLGTTGGLTFTATGTGVLQITGSTFTSAKSVTLDGTGTFELDNTDSGSLTGNITGAGGLTKTGSGGLTLSGSNDYQGVTTVSGGTLTASAVTSLPQYGAFNIGPSGSLVLMGDDVPLGSMLADHAAGAAMIYSAAPGVVDDSATVSGEFLAKPQAAESAVPPAPGGGSFDPASVPEPGTLALLAAAAAGLFAMVLRRKQA
jgi:autotransporter-associated beta strand protein